MGKAARGAEAIELDRLVFRIESISKTRIDSIKKTNKVRSALHQMLPPNPIPPPNFTAAQGVSVASPGSFQTPLNSPTLRERDHQQIGPPLDTQFCRWFTHARVRPLVTDGSAKSHKMSTSHRSSI
ncbi:hypothetical protein CsSME_00043994 [Camellia sinensis var. sinensis]